MKFSLRLLGLAVAMFAITSTSNSQQPPPPKGGGGVNAYHWVFTEIKATDVPAGITSRIRVENTSHTAFQVRYRVMACTDMYPLWVDVKTTEAFSTIAGAPGGPLAPPGSIVTTDVTFTRSEMPQMAEMGMWRVVAQVKLPMGEWRDVWVTEEHFTYPPE